MHEIPTSPCLTFGENFLPVERTTKFRETILFSIGSLLRTSTWKEVIIIDGLSGMFCGDGLTASWQRDLPDGSC
jgi:hypothetical protein